MREHKDAVTLRDFQFQAGAPPPTAINLSFLAGHKVLGRGNFQSSGGSPSEGHSPPRASLSQRVLRGLCGALGPCDPGELFE